MGWAAVDIRRNACIGYISEEEATVFINELNVR